MYGGKWELYIFYYCLRKTTALCIRKIILVLLQSCTKKKKFLQSYSFIHAQPSDSSHPM